MMSFDLVGLGINGQIFPVIVLIQILWIVIISILFFKRGNIQRLYLNLALLQFSVVISMFYHYISTIRIMNYEYGHYKEELPWYVDDILYALDLWLSFFSYEMVIGALVFVTFLFVYINEKKDK